MAIGTATGEVAVGVTIDPVVTDFVRSINILVAAIGPEPTIGRALVITTQVLGGTVVALLTGGNHAIPADGLASTGRIIEATQRKLVR